MSAPARAIGAARTESRGGLLYGWLLVALFVEYARPANQLTFLDFPYFYSLVPLSLLVVSMFAQGLRPMAEIMSDRIAKWVFIFLGLITFSVAWAPVFEYSYDVFITVLGRVFLFVLIARLATSEARIRGIIVTLFLAHAWLLAWNPAALTNPQERNYLVGASFLGDGNDFALSLCILLPCMFEITQGSKSRIAKLLASGGVLLIVFAIIATQSRGGTLGLIVVVAYLWWRSFRKLATAVAIGFIAVAALMYAPEQYFERMDTILTDTRDGSAQGRIDAWKAAIGMGVKNPVLGAGTGHFGARWGRTAHSSFMLAFGELGFPGLICILMLVFGNIRDNSRLRTRLLAGSGPAGAGPIQSSARLIDMLSVAMVGFAVAGAFLSATYYPHLYILTGLIVSARLVAARYLPGAAPANSRGRAGALAARSVA